MRALCAWFLLLVSVTAASAADLKIKVVDPQSAAVAGAKVSVFSTGSGTALKIETTSAEGIADFSELSPGSYRVQVLAAGFAPQVFESHESAQSRTVGNLVTVHLHLAANSETVVVTATRTPELAEETGASVSLSRTLNLKPCTPSRPMMPFAFCRAP